MRISSITPDTLDLSKTRKNTTRPNINPFKPARLRHSPIKSLQSCADLKLRNNSISNFLGSNRKYRRRVKTQNFPRKEPATEATLEEAISGFD